MGPRPGGSIERPGVAWIGARVVRFPGSPGWSAAPAPVPRDRSRRCSPLAVQVWFTRVLRDGFAAQLAGSYHPFRQFAENHLACLLEQHASRAAK